MMGNPPSISRIRVVTLAEAGEAKESLDGRLVSRLKGEVLCEAVRNEQLSITYADWLCIVVIHFLQSHLTSIETGPANPIA